MSDRKNPATPAGKDEKFKPQDVLGEDAGRTGEGRREMKGTNTARGSEAAQRGTAGRRG